MTDCKICGQPRAGFILNNKSVCLRCDELLFDLEIELEEEPKSPRLEKRDEPAAAVKSRVPKR